MSPVYAINVYKNDLRFKRTLPRDDLHVLLMASSNVKKKVFFLEQVFLIKFLTIIKAAYSVTMNFFRKILFSF